MKEKNLQTEIKSTGGIAPFGYVWEDGKLVVEKEEAPVRKLIYKLFLKHRRKKTVANILNELGYRTRLGANFSDTTIDRLLRDTTAKGTRMIEGHEIKTEAIIDEDIWQRANNLLGKKPTKQTKHLFSGFIFCECGGKMSLLSSKSSSSKYSCKNCKQKIESEAVKEAFLYKLQSFSLKPSQEHKGNLSLSSLDTANSLADYWQYLTKREQRIITENLVSKITIQKNKIHLKFTLTPDSFKATDLGQRNADATKPAELEEIPPPKPAQDEPLMSEQEAADFLGISKMTLMRRRKSKKIGYYRVGFRVLYSKEKHLLPFLEKCEK